MHIELWIRRTIMLVWIWRDQMARNGRGATSVSDHSDRATKSAAAAAAAATAAAAAAVSRRVTGHSPPPGNHHRRRVLSDKGYKFSYRR